MNMSPHLREGCGTASTAFSLQLGEDGMLNSGLFPETPGYMTASKLWCTLRCVMLHAET